MKTKEKVFEESSDEEENEKREDDNEEEYVCKMLEVEMGKKGNLKERMVKDLKEIVEVVNKERSKVADVIRASMESSEEDVGKSLSTIFLVQLCMEKLNEPPGEWLYMKIDNMKKYLAGTDMRIVPTMLNAIFKKTAAYYMPQDLVVKMECGGGEMSGEGSGIRGEKEKYEEGGKEGDDEEEYGDGKEVILEKEMKIRKAELRIKVMASQMTNMKKSKNGFPELGLPITSIVLSRKWMYVCPLEGCSDAFQSPRMCDAHLNRHLGYEYGPCHKCGYTSSSRDAFEKYKCFAGAKTGGKKPASRSQNVKKGNVKKRVSVIT